jgi:hypothetical protein
VWCHLFPHRGGVAGNGGVSSTRDNDKPGRGTRSHRRDMVGKDKVTEAWGLPLVRRAGREPPSGPSATMARRAGRDGCTAHRRTRGPCRGTEASSPALGVRLAKRGKPDALSGAVQSRSPWSRPRASTGNGGAGKGRGSKHKPRSTGGERGSCYAPGRKAADFPWVCPDDKTTHTANRGSVYQGEAWNSKRPRA